MDIDKLIADFIGRSIQLGYVISSSLKKGWIRLRPWVKFAVWLVFFYIVIRVGTSIYDTLPNPIEVSFPKPMNYEFFSWDKVTTGTFKIDLSVNDLIKRANESNKKVIVVWNQYQYNYSVIEYWLPEQNYFYYAREKLDPWKNDKFMIDEEKSTIAKDKIFAYPKRNPNTYVGLWILYGMLLFSAMGLLYTFMHSTSHRDDE